MKLYLMSYYKSPVLESKSWFLNGWELVTGEVELADLKKMQK